jgi:predicted Holliday junction resolvase-like endonuclease
MKIKRRSIEVFSMSFLDVISCGFGAIILLLVLSLALEPRTLEFMKSDLSGKVEEIKKELQETAVESQVLTQELAQKRKTLQESQQVLTQLEKDLQEARENDPAAQAKIKEELQAVVQTLTDEMRRLLNQSYASLDRDAVIGGIPVDSEYIIFVIDTSGSMLTVAWPLVVRKVEEVLTVYPNVKGLQVVNDMGNYMFGAYAGKWIPDTPARRREVIRRLKSWNSFSNSSPVEGIQHAVRVFFKQGERISLYVFGDDFSSGSINSVLDEVARINRQNKQGKPRVRIHTFGFPVLFTNPRYDQGNKVRFAHLMRLLAEQNAGSFVGLNDVR